MKKFALIFIALLAAGYAGAETHTLTVDEAVEMSIAQNLVLRQSGLDFRSKERTKRTAWNVFLPSMVMSVGTNFSHSDGLFNDEDPRSFSSSGNIGINAGLALSLPLNAAAAVAFKQTKADYDSGVLEYEDARKSLIRDVRKLFYRLLAEQEGISIQQANIELARKQLEQAQNNYDNGLARNWDVLSAEVAVANLQSAYDSIVAAYESQLLLFKFTIGADIGDEVVLKGDLEPEFHELNADELIAAHLPRRLDIRILEKQIAGLQFAKTADALYSNSPTVTLGYTWGLTGSNANMDALTQTELVPFEKWGDSGTLSLSLRWRFDGFIPGSRTNVRLKETQTAIDNLEITGEIAREQASMEIINLVNGLATARKNIEVNTSSVDLARRNYELVEEAYSVGTQTFLDVESAQNSYLEASQQLLLAKYTYVASLLDLEYALNAPVDEFAAQ